jgi:hypothetical protein
LSTFDNFKINLALQFAYMTKKFVPLFLFILLHTFAYAQYPENENEILDSLYIQEVEGKKAIDKVLHAEPLYIDLIRDLGARKGEKEWNFGFGLTDRNRGDIYTALVEYEWAPIDHLGLEIELPFSFYYPNQLSADVRSSKLNSLKVAAQYSFYVSEKKSTSMAIGYIHEFELTDFNKYRKSNIYQGNIYNPFLVLAKRWGNNYHTLIYSGPSIFTHLYSNKTELSWQVNSNIHYMIPGTRNFIGMEVNKNFIESDFDMVLRPQMRVGIADNLLIGIVTGIPINRANDRLSTFLRIIYEPGH